MEWRLVGFINKIKSHWQLFRFYSLKLLLDKFNYNNLLSPYINYAAGLEMEENYQRMFLADPNSKQIYIYIFLKRKKHCCISISFLGVRENFLIELEFGKLNKSASCKKFFFSNGYLLNFIISIILVFFLYF